MHRCATENDIFCVYSAMPKAVRDEEELKLGGIIRLRCMHFFSSRIPSLDENDFPHMVKLRSFGCKAFKIGLSR